MSEKKIILITGASGGIGAACAKKLAKSLDCKLILCGRKLKKLHELERLLKNEYGTRAYSAHFDLSQPSDIERFMQSLPKSWADIAALINNAGLGIGFATFQDSPISNIDLMIDCNIKGTLYLTHFILKNMVKNNAGHIVNIASIAGHVVYPKGLVYCATKHAATAISKGLRMDLMGTNIRVSNISPGLTKTGFNAIRFGDSEKGEQSYEGVQYLLPEDVADAVFYAITRPPHVNIDEIVIMPQQQVAATVLNKGGKSHES